MRFLILSLFVLSLALTISCTELSPTKPQEMTYSPSWEAKDPKRKEWSDFTVQMIQENIDVFDGASDVTSFCPKYKTLTEKNRAYVWTEMVSAIAKRESNWSPTTTDQEPPPPKGPGTLSVGLLQMSIGDGYPNCFKKGESSDLLMIPFNNLRCGISAMVSLIKRDGVIVGTAKPPYRGLTRYWSVTRAGHHIDEIKAATKKVPGC